MAAENDNRACPKDSKIFDNTGRIAKGAARKHDHYCDGTGTIQNINPGQGGEWNECGVNRARSSSSTISSVVSGQRITASDVNSFMAAIKSEIDGTNDWKSWRNSITKLTTANVGEGDGIEVKTFIDMATTLTSVAKADIENSSGWVENINFGGKPTAVGFNKLISNYNILTNNCVCNSDCGANLQCTCNNDCGCHY
jgi:hypothetical protein